MRRRCSTGPRPRVVVRAEAEDEIALVADEAISVADVDVVGIAVAVEIAVLVLRRVGVVRDLRERTDVVRDLAAEQQAGRGEDDAVVLLEVAGRVVGLRRVGHLRKRGHCHPGDWHRALADRVAGHLERTSVGRELRELSSGVTGDAVLPGLSVEGWDRRCIGRRQRQD